MNDIWYRKLGFRENPFSIKPSIYFNEIVAYDLDFIYQKIDNGEMVFIDGPYGTGKTTILKKIISHYKGKNRIIYYNFNKAETKLEMKSQLSRVNSLFKNLIGLPPKNVILLLDEVGTIKKKEAIDILRHYREGILKSIIFVNHDYYSVALPPDIEQYLRGNVIRTAKLNTKEAVDLVRKRIGDTEFLPDSMIRRIFVLAEYNPRKLLEYCEDVCKYAAEIGETMVTEEHVSEVIRIKQKKKELKAKEEPSPMPAMEIKVEPAVQEKMDLPVFETEKPKAEVKAVKASRSRKKQEEVPEVPEYRVLFYENADKE